LINVSTDNGLEAARLQARFMPVVDLASALSSAIVLWVGATRVLHGSLDVAVLLVFLGYVSTVYKPLKALARLSTALSKGAAASERVFDVLSQAPDVEDRPDALASGPSFGRIEFCDVSFSYGREPVLDGLSFSVEPGETVGLVGPTGSGKSTVAALLARLMDPQQGSVQIDGIDARAYKVAALRSKVSLVLQDSLLLDGTLFENIACVRPGVTEWQVREAARRALVDEFADRLPDGLHTMVGERGAELSGGQRQRVAIARAIVRDAPILVLDEPTSALDSLSERLIVQALEQLPAGRTTLVIAHRLSTVQRADRIAVLRAGQIVELGTPAELAAAGGLYSDLSGAQGRPALGVERWPTLSRAARGAS
jgi:ABC-type multidrug transport system fused ATPase/permease subunit